VGYFPGRQLGFGGREARGVIRDWSRQALTGKYRPAGERRDVERLLGLLKGEVLVFTIEGDRFAPVKAVDNLCAKLAGSAIRHEHILPRDYGIETMDHFNWVKNPGPFIGKIKEWLGKE
jgi:predicted alpha/beta hydrolase